ncbi:polysaccharide deacetylase family protein [Candidatus Entotheonella palauensis]|uniref:polysaccharide deacetylase family protein n=1 Tax=Candidatus Entotheonella palauensis TaxID=93172 RepID=UPI0015C4D5BA|nr:polysaccharide deacetylase family protein [Candidatus Entotheonella palauensis]
MNMKKKFKLGLLWLARGLGLFWLARRLTRHGIVIIGWHAVSMTDEHQRFPELFIAPETLRCRLRYLQQHFEIISLDEALTQYERGAIRPGQAVLTFDDGYYNFAHQAAPILRQFQATATVYLLSSHMVNQEPFHAPLIKDMVSLAPLTNGCGDAQDVRFPGIQTPQALQTEADRKALAGAAQRHLSTLPMEARTAYTRQLAESLGLDFEALSRQQVWRSLNCDEVRRLAEDGFGMQLHGHHHLNVVDFADRALNDVTTCRKLVEAASGRAAQHFCYPSGFWTREAWQMLQAAGMRSATTTRQGPNFITTPPFALRRVLDGEEQSQIEFEFGVSSLRWLIHTFFHPERRHSPSEKRARYHEDGVLF